jgi:hypothetical protein
MNRILVMGIAVFVAVIGLSLLSGDSSSAYAGHGCCGCHGYDACHGCHGAVACHGCHGGRGCHGLFRRHRCHGCHGCAGYNGGQAAPPPADSAAPPPPPAASRTYQREPFGFRNVVFRR